MVRRCAGWHAAARAAPRSRRGRPNAAPPRSPAHRRRNGRRQPDLCQGRSSRGYLRRGQSRVPGYVGTRGLNVKQTRGKRFACPQCLQFGHPSRKRERMWRGPHVTATSELGWVIPMDMDSPASVGRVDGVEARPVVLITGASSGIGAALAHVFAQNGHEVVLAARRAPQLAEIASRIRTAGHRAPHIVSVDLGRADAAEFLARELSARNLEPAYLVNNAGYGLLGPAAKLDRNDQLAMIDLNCLARYRGGI